jgi:hypothetical protein
MLATIRSLLRASNSLSQTCLLNSRAIPDRLLSRSVFRQQSSSTQPQAPGQAAPLAAIHRQPTPRGQTSKQVINNLKQRLSAVRVAGISLGIFVLLAGLPILLWPVFDMYLLPFACRKSVSARKFDRLLLASPDPTAAIKQLQQAVDDNARSVVCLVGPDASDLAKHFAHAQSLCGYLDYRRLFDMNPFELACLEHLGFMGNGCVHGVATVQHDL